MTVIYKQRFAWFVAFSGIHLSLWAALGFLPSDFGGGVMFLSVLPWLPWAWLDLPVSARGLLVLPNTAGLLWCAMVWLAIYWFLGGVVARLTPRSRTDRPQAADR